MSNFFPWLYCLWFGHNFEIEWTQEFMGWNKIHCLRCGKEPL